MYKSMLYTTNRNSEKQACTVRLGTKDPHGRLARAFSVAFANQGYIYTLAFSFDAAPAFHLPRSLLAHCFLPDRKKLASGSFAIGGYIISCLWQIPVEREATNTLGYFLPHCHVRSYYVHRGKAPAFWLKIHGSTLIGFCLISHS